MLLLARDPDDPEAASGTRRVLAHVKSNVGQLAPSVAFKVEAATVAGEIEVESARLLELGESPFTAAELLVVEEPQVRSKLAEAEQLLRSELQQGTRAVSEIRAAADELGISPTTLDRAKKQLGISSVKLDLHRWGWRLPTAIESEGESAGA